MSIGNFPSELVVITLDTPMYQMGKFTPTVSGQLQQVRTRFFFKDLDRIGLRLTVYTSADYNSQLIGTSDWVYTKQIDSFATNWLGDIVFTIQTPCAVTSGQPIYLLLDVQGYDRVTSTNYVAVVCDWPLPVDSSAGSHPRTELFINEIRSF